jgi:hypothetical protein
MMQIALSKVNMDELELLLRRSNRRYTTIVGFVVGWCSCDLACARVDAP